MKYSSDPKQEFEAAIQDGELTDVAGQPDYAGDFMYMCTFVRGGVEFNEFKHCDTRKVILIKRKADCELLGE